jgi:hypothetical protein
MIPDRIFIVPYRDRPVHKNMFLKQMREILGPNELDKNDELLKNTTTDTINNTLTYKIYFSHQCDNRPFNRGAVKNIGFLAMKKKYPLHYKNITFIFHDVDTWPTRKGLLDYNTTHGVVKHFYGFIFTLGGMFAIKGDDFEKSLGFPNFWGWGLEDNVMNERCLKVGLTIDRSNFFHIKDRNIARAFDGFNRNVSKRDSVVYKFETPDNINSLKNIKINIENEFINITGFDCEMRWEDQVYKTHDIRNGNKLRLPQGFNRRVWSMSKMME